MPDKFLTTQACLMRLQRGDAVHMQLTPSGREFWFENPYERVSQATLDKAAAGDLMELGDSLFGLRMNSQTWALIRGKA